jgi:hypothetical protein
MPLWAWLIPVLSLALLVAALVAGVGTLLAVLCSAALVGAIIVAVHHAKSSRIAWATLCYSYLPWP